MDFCYKRHCLILRDASLVAFTKSSSFFLCSDLSEAYKMYLNTFEELLYRCRRSWSAWYSEICLNWFLDLRDIIYQRVNEACRFPWNLAIDSRNILIRKVELFNEEGAALCQIISWRTIFNQSRCFVVEMYLSNFKIVNL